MVQVKGKGEMQTYLVLGKEMGSPAGVHRQPSSRSSISAVIYGMVQARKRHNSTKQGYFIIIYCSYYFFYKPTIVITTVHNFFFKEE